MNDEKLDEMERQLVEIIEQIRRDFEKAAAPYVKRLADLRTLRQVKIVMPNGDWHVPIARAWHSASEATK